MSLSAGYKSIKTSHKKAFSRSIQTNSQFRVPKLMSVEAVPCLFSNIQLET
jgi:hypothetical protein